MKKNINKMNFKELLNYFTKHVHNDCKEIDIDHVFYEWKVESLPLYNIEYIDDLIHKLTIFSKKHGNVPVEAHNDFITLGFKKPLGITCVRKNINDILKDIDTRSKVSDLNKKLQDLDKQINERCKDLMEEQRKIEEEISDLDKNDEMIMLG